jgi:hypothetical protein
MISSTPYTLPGQTGCQACCSGEPAGTDPLFQVSSVSF